MFVASVGMLLAVVSSVAGLPAPWNGLARRGMGDSPFYASQPPGEGGRAVVYYQTQFDPTRGNAYVSPTGLLNTGASNVLLTAHLNSTGNDSLVVLNNLVRPDDPMYDQLWTDLALLQAGGVDVSATFGGDREKVKDFTLLSEAFDVHYPTLRDFLRTFKLNGLDLNIEETTFSTAATENLILALRRDFGPNFQISMSPVATELEPDPPTTLSNVDYQELYGKVGNDIDFFNLQFYNSWGYLTGNSYRYLVQSGFPARKLVAGIVANPSDGEGYLDPTIVWTRVRNMRANEFPDFGGVAGWEYYNMLPGNNSAPEQWARIMWDALNGPVNENAEEEWNVPGFSPRRPSCG